MWPYILIFLGGMFAGVILIVGFGLIMAAGRMSRDDERGEEELGRML